MYMLINKIIHKEENVMTVKEVRDSLRGEQVVKALKQEIWKLFLLIPKQMP